jgi:hypothetical protein
MGDLLVERNVEARTVLALQVDERELERFVPERWTSAPAGAGPSSGANLNVILSDRLLVQDRVGSSVPMGSLNQLAVLAVPADHAYSRARGVIIAFGLSASPEGAPGPDGVFMSADAAKFERTVAADSQGLRIVQEQWLFSSADGERLQVQLKQSRGIPIRSTPTTRAWSGLDPTSYRTYRADQGLMC